VAVRFFLGTGPIQSPSTFSVLDAYFDAGGRDFDTARVYGNSEPTLGDWIRTRGVQDEVRVLTKGAHPDQAVWKPRLSKTEILDDVRTSQDALGLHSVDSYLLHRDDPQRPVDEIAQTLSGLVADGFAQRIGVSNWSTPRVVALADALSAAGAPPIAWVSNYYGLAQGNSEFPFPGCSTADEELRQLARGLGFRTLSWSAQSSGYFAGADRPYFDGPESRRRREILRRVATERGVDPLGVLARWLVAGDPVIVPIFGTGKPEHVRQLIEWAADDGFDEAVADVVRTIGKGIRDPGSFQ
jgi:aryl-alcohol dehydrogenase-like predicted oxidoreductase